MKFKFDYILKRTKTPKIKSSNLQDLAPPCAVCQVLQHIYNCVKALEPKISAKYKLTTKLPTVYF